MTLYSDFCSWYYANPEQHVKGIVVDKKSLRRAIKSLKHVEQKRIQPKDWDTKTDLTKEFRRKMKRTRNMLDWNSLYPDKNPQYIHQKSCYF